LAKESGPHKLALSSIGVSTLYIDGELVIGTQGSTVDPVSFLQGNAEEEDLLTPEVTIVFVGNTYVWESEGHDTTSMNLPADGSQDALISAVAEANPKTIVVNSTGVPIAMSWLSKVKAVLQTWFPGQEASNAINDILTGAANPSGRPPVTFPRRLEDSPAYGKFPGDTEEVEVNYAEGSFIGYRYYDHVAETVVFQFDHGLS
jgi:beta-glucosidase